MPTQHLDLIGEGKELEEKGMDTTNESVNKTSTKEEKIFTKLPNKASVN